MMLTAIWTAQVAADVCSPAIIILGDGEGGSATAGDHENRKRFLSEFIFCGLLHMNNSGPGGSAVSLRPPP